MSNLYQRLNSVMKEVQTVFKNVKVSGYGAGYKGVSHDDVTALLHKPLVEAGIQTNINMVSPSLNPIQGSQRVNRQRFADLFPEDAALIRGIGSLPR